LHGVSFVNGFSLRNAATLCRLLLLVFRLPDWMSGGLRQPENRIIASRAHALCFGGQSGRQQAGIMAGQGF
jgi:hypothetical protein